MRKEQKGAAKEGNHGREKLHSARAYDSTPRLPFCLLAGAASRKRICSGRERNEKQVIRAAARRSRPGRAHAPRRCAAIPDCRISGSGHRANPETERGGREISLRKTRTATARRRRCQADSQRLSCAGSAGISNCDTLGKRTRSLGSSISPGWLDP